MLTAVPMIVAALTSTGEPSLRQKPCRAVDRPDGMMNTLYQNRYSVVSW